MPGGRSPFATGTSRLCIFGGHAGRWLPAARSSVRLSGRTPPIRSARRIFRDKASKIITDFAHAAVNNKELGESCDHETWIKWQALAKSGGLDSRKEAHWNILRFALLDFIADFANWDNSTVQEYLETSRALTQAAHEALGGEPGTRPLVVDPFAGGGSIPLEALRVGADAFASDLNPVPVLLNKVVLEYIPRYGQRLADEVRKWGEWIKQEAEKELADSTRRTRMERRRSRIFGPGPFSAKARLRRGSSTSQIALVGEESEAFCRPSTRPSPEGKTRRFPNHHQRGGRLGKQDDRCPRLPARF